MSSPIISVEGLGKRYYLAHQKRQDTLRDSITQGVLGLFKSNASAAASAREEFWALRDISFQVNQGDVVGIIGRNGAGKSTLLKILSRITEPTSGRAVIRGRVASLLEVGTGFHPELSGRENIFLNGAILGMSRAEITRKFDEIVAFAEVERFLDTQVKHYSSGMYVRLAFAVAAHLEPEILIVDEVLAVGDAQFQKKCLGKMKDVAKHSGRTVLFVSHNLAAVQALCGRCAYLVAGRIKAFGETPSVLDGYMADTNQLNLSSTRISREVLPGLQMDTLSFIPAHPLSGAPVSFSISLSSVEAMTITDLCLVINAGNGTRVAILDLRSSQSLWAVTPGQPLTVQGKIPRLNLIEGNYTVDAYVGTKSAQRDITELCALQVLPALPSRGIPPYAARDRGYVELPFEFSGPAGKPEDHPQV